MPVPSLDRHLFQYADTNGDGTGTKIANVNGSVTPQYFYVTPQAGEWLSLERMIVHIEDTSAGWTSGAYGSVSPVANGVTVEIVDAQGNVLLDLLGGLPITSNGEWGRVCFDVLPVDFGAGNNHLNIRWTFSKSGEPVAINVSEGESLRIGINDDLTGLVDHTFNVQGVRYYETVKQ